MKKIISSILAFSLALCLLTTAEAAGAGTIVYSNTQQIASNLTYTDTVSYINSTERQNSYALSLTGKGDAYPIVMDDTMYGRLTIDQIISYAEGLGKNVLAAVNTDFFSTQTGVPLGIVVENGVYKSSPECNTAVAFRPDGSVYFSDNPEVTITLANNGSSLDMTNIGQTVSLTHFNKFRTNSGLYLFSSAFSTVSTRTSSPGWFVRFKILSGTPSVAGTMSLEVTETLTSDSAIPIGDGYLVLTAADAATTFGAEFTKFKTGDIVTMTTSCSDPELNNAQWATGGGDILVKGGAMTDKSGWDTAISSKNPRTALGVKADGTIITLVVDGRESDHSSGLTLQCLAEEMLARGCVYAVNLDGGGSSAMSIRMPGQAGCTVINKPSDGSSRKCGSYLLFVTDKVSDGAAKNLSMQHDGPIVLAGSSVNLSYFASDGGYKPVAAPSDIRAQSSGLGAVSGSVYTAGAVHGVDKVTLSSNSTGATGYATMHIIYDPTELRVTANGETAPASLTVWPGDTVQFAASAFYNALPVIADPSSYKYTVSGDIGAVSETGLYTAGGAAGVTGTIALTVGGKSVNIPVTVAGFSDVLNHWSKPFVKGLSDMNVVTGVTPVTYAPDISICRGDFVLMLYRAAGKPAVTDASPFTDVLPEDYYGAAIAWAAQNGIAQGDGTGLFNPKNTLTREQAFTFLYRALDDLRIPYTDASVDTLSDFKDKNSVSDYAVTPAATLVRMGVVSGADGNLKPAAAITRGEMAKILFASLDKA